MEFDPSLPWRDIKGEGYNAHIGPIRFAEMDADSGDGARRWCATVLLDARHINVGGVCHGGMLLSFADVAMGASTFAAGDGHPCATIQMDGHFIAAAKKGQRLLGVARQLRKVRDLSFMACEIWATGGSAGESGARLVMRASGTWKYLASRAPGASGTGQIV